MKITVELIKEFVQKEILTLPELAPFENSLNILLTGSRAVGGYSDKSDVDLDIICTEEVYTKIQTSFYENGKTVSVNASYYSLENIDYLSYFGDIAPPHFSIIPLERILHKLRNYDEVQMWIWGNSKVLIDNGITSVFKQNLFCFENEILIYKLKKYYMEFLYNIIDGYPSHDNSNEMKHVAAYSIYNGLINLYRFCYIAERRPFPYTEKLIIDIKTTKIFKECDVYFSEIYSLLEKLDDETAWERLEKARGMLVSEDLYESAVVIANLIDNALLENGCEPGWVAAGYNNIDDYFLS